MTGRRFWASLIAVALLAAACTGGDGATTTTTAPGATTTTTPEPILLHCPLSSECPEVLIDGDPFALLGAGPSPFRGYGDPSLEAGPDGVVWLAYSWLELVIADPGPPLVADLGVRTHLARSEDGGDSFQFVRALNDLALAPHPDTGIPGWTQHEVPTLVGRPEGDWQVAWLDYFDKAGGAVDRSDIRLTSSRSADPASLGDRAETLLTGVAASASYPARLEVPDSRCAAFTEPALFSHGGTTYLALHCVGELSADRDPAAEAIVLLREGSDGYEVVGDLVTGVDAAALGYDVLTQPDLAVARDGSVILLVTPKNLDEDPAHQGCIVLTVADIGTASVVRAEDGVPAPRVVVTGDGNGLGPGLCSYDAASSTGILMVLTTFDSDPVDIVFSLRRTGVHP